MIIKWAEATWTEARAFLAAAPDAIGLIPVGAIEAHGPHLPLATDVIIAKGLARRAAAALQGAGRAVAICPPLQYSVTRYAGGFPGTAGVGPEAAAAYVKDVCAGLRGAGLRRLVLANAHLEPAHVEVLRGVPDVAFPDCTERRFARTLTDEFKRGACHAGSYETSLILAERPELVRDTRLSLPDLPIDLARAMRDGLTTFEAAGAADAYFGNPAAATVEEGEWIYDRLVDMIVTVVTETWP